jgi:hypothetical protein
VVTAAACAPGAHAQLLVGSKGQKENLETGSALETARLKRDGWPGVPDGGRAPRTQPLLNCDEGGLEGQTVTRCRARRARWEQWGRPPLHHRRPAPL